MILSLCLAGGGRCGIMRFMRHAAAISVISACCLGFLSPLAGFADGRDTQAAKVPSNTVHVIWPYNIQGIWAFDDEPLGLVREPFVGAINTMIDRLVTNIPNAKVGFRLMFSAGFIPDYDAKIVWKRKAPRGNWYYCEKFKMEGWLCPALLKYFKKPPKEIYVKVGPLPKELIEAWKKKRRRGWFNRR